VRGSAILTDFKSVLLKSWKRAGKIYLLHIIMVLYAIMLGLWVVSHSLVFYSTNALPDISGWPLLWQIVKLSYPLGWADFLMYFAVYMFFAPFLLYAIRSRFWLPTLLGSLFLFIMSSSLHYGNFYMWQLYFVIGLILARFRIQLISRFYRLPRLAVNGIFKASVTATALVLAVSIPLGFNLFPFVNNLAVHGWLPAKASAAYQHLLNYQPKLYEYVDFLRHGALRPAVSLLFLITAYMFYQRHKDFLLNKTGKFVNSIGSDTLAVYVAQALLIPIIAAAPLPRDFIVNLALTSLLLSLMWLVVKRKPVLGFVKRRTLRMHNLISDYRRPLPLNAEDGV
jgi:hypothetical protein